MDIIKIRELTEEGEEELNINLNDSLEVPHGENETNKSFKIDDVKECFNKVFAIRELISLVGSIAIHQEEDGNDVDLVLAISDLPEDLQTAIKFRLMRGFSSYFNISYNEVSKYLHLHEKENSESPFTSWVSIYKLALIPTPNEERTIRKMSLGDEKFEILEKSKEFVIGGFVSDTSIDLENERINPDALKEIWNSIKKTPDEFRGLYDCHSSTCIGSMMMDYKNRKCALINNKLYLIFKLRNDIPVAKQINDKIKSGEISSFSIKFGIKNPRKNVREVCNENQCVTEILGNTYYIETSITDSPANENTTMEILSK